MNCFRRRNGRCDFDRRADVRRPALHNPESGPDDALAAYRLLLEFLARDDEPSWRAWFAVCFMLALFVLLALTLGR